MIVGIWVIILKGHEIDIPEISRMLTHLKEVKRTWPDTERFVYIWEGEILNSKKLDEFYLPKELFLLSYNIMFDPTDHNIQLNFENVSKKW